MLKYFLCINISIKYIDRMVSELILGTKKTLKLNQIAKNLGTIVTKVIQKTYILDQYATL